MKEIKTSKLWVHFAGYFLCFVLAGLIAAIPRFIIGMENESGLIIFISEMIRIPVSIAVLYFYTKYIARIPINKETLTFENFRPLKWALVGILMPALVILIFYFSGNLEVLQTNFTLDQSLIIDNILKAFGMSLAAGIIEELVFRGYMVNLLSRKYSFWIAGIIPSLLFTIIHIGAAKSVLNIFQLLVAGMLVSIMFLVIYKRTGSIWNASVVHFLWNFLFFEEMIDYGNSNEPLNKLIEIDLGQNELITGGAFGIDISIPAIIVYSLILMISWKFINRTAYNKV
jgi:membrane protease YdiL (CAAX protease family)